MVVLHVLFAIWLLSTSATTSQPSVTVKQLTVLCAANNGVMYKTSCHRVYQQSARVITWNEAILGCDVSGMPPAHGAWWGHDPLVTAIFSHLTSTFQANIGIGHTFTGMRRLNTSGTVGQGIYFVGRAGDGSDVRIGPMGDQSPGTYTVTPIWKAPNPNTFGDARMILVDDWSLDDELASSYTLEPNGTYNMACQYDPTLLVNSHFKKVADLMLSLTVGGGGVMQKSVTSSIQCGQECIRLHGLCLTYSFGPTGGCRIGVSIDFSYHWHIDYCDPSTTTGDQLYELVDIYPDE